MEILKTVITFLIIAAACIATVCLVGSIRAILYNRKWYRHFKDDYKGGGMVEDILCNLNKDLKNFIGTALILAFVILTAFVYLWMTGTGRLWGV